MELILLLSFCAVVFTVPIPTIPGASSKDWLSTGFRKMDSARVCSPKCNSCCAALPVIANAFVGKSCECTPEGEPCTDVNCVANYESNFRVPYCENGKWVINTWCYPQTDNKKVVFWNKNHTTIFSSALSVAIVAIIIVIATIIYVTYRFKKAIMISDNGYKPFINDEVKSELSVVNSGSYETINDFQENDAPSVSFVAPAIPTEADKGTDNDKDTVADTDGKDVGSLNANGDKTNDDSIYHSITGSYKKNDA